jgi:hypothetical protein
MMKRERARAARVMATAMRVASNKEGKGNKAMAINEVQHAPSANEHRHKRAGIDAVIAELLEDMRELHFNFSELFSP